MKFFKLALQISFFLVLIAYSGTTAALILEESFENEDYEYSWTASQESIDSHTISLSSNAHSGRKALRIKKGWLSQVTKNLRYQFTPATEGNDIFIRFYFQLVPVKLIKSDTVNSWPVTLVSIRILNGQGKNHNTPFIWIKSLENNRFKLALVSREKKSGSPLESPLWKEPGIEIQSALETMAKLSTEFASIRVNSRFTACFRLRRASQSVVQ